MTRWLVMLLLLLAACGGEKKPTSTPTGGSARALTDMSACETADDCTLVEACCGCNAVGRRVAIRKDAVAEFEGTKAQRCAGNLCKQGISSHSSCDAEAGCEHGRCKVITHMGGLP